MTPPAEIGRRRFLKRPFHTRSSPLSGIDSSLVFHAPPGRARDCRDAHPLPKPWGARSPSRSVAQEVSMSSRRPFGRSVPRAAAFVAGLGLVAQLGVASPATADPLRCERAILKATSKVAQSTMRTLVRCEDGKL